MLRRQAAFVLSRNREAHALFVVTSPILVHKLLLALLVLRKIVSSSMVSIIVLQWQVDCRYRREAVVRSIFGQMTAMPRLCRKKCRLLTVSSRYFALAEKVRGRQNALVLVRSRPFVRRPCTSPYPPTRRFVIPGGRGGFISVAGLVLRGAMGRLSISQSLCLVVSGLEWCP